MNNDKEQRRRKAHGLHCLNGIKTKKQTNGSPSA